MAQQTNYGLTYPEPGDHTRLWEHFQQLAEDVDNTRAASPIRVESRSTDQTIANATTEAVVINNTLLNRGAIGRPGGGVLEVPTRGIYAIQASIMFSGSSAGSLRMAQLKINGSTMMQDRREPLSGYGTTCHTHYLALMNPGDQVRMDAYQNSGSGLAIGTSSQGVTLLAVYMLSPVP